MGFSDVYANEKSCLSIHQSRILLSSIWLGEQFVFPEVPTSNNNLFKMPFLGKYSDILHFTYSELISPFKNILIYPFILYTLIMHQLWAKYYKYEGQ